VVGDEGFEFVVESFLVVEVVEVDGLVEYDVLGEVGGQGVELPVVDEFASFVGVAPSGGVLDSGLLGVGFEVFPVFFDGFVDEVSGLLCYPFLEGG